MELTGQIVVTVLGIVGLSGIVSAIRSSRRLSRHNRFFRFQRIEPVDFVLTTSARESGGYGIKYLRSVTAVGNLKGSTEIAQAIGYASPRRPIVLAASAELESTLDGDLIVIGLPGKNAASQLVLTHLRAQYPDLRLSIKESPTDGCRMTLNDFSEAYSVCEQPDTRIPTRDLALIVLWVNPLTLRKRRLVLCAGFTAYGTAAAASYLVDDILNCRIDELRKEHRSLPSLWGRRWLCFAMVIETHLIHDQVVDINERVFVPLDDPGCPPFRAPASSPDSARDERNQALGFNKVGDDVGAPGNEPVSLGKAQAGGLDGTPVEEDA